MLFMLFYRRAVLGVVVEGQEVGRRRRHVAVVGALVDGEAVPVICFLVYVLLLYITS